MKKAGEKISPAFFVLLIRFEIYARINIYDLREKSKLPKLSTSPILIFFVLFWSV